MEEMYELELTKSELLALKEALKYVFETCEEHDVNVEVILHKITSVYIDKAMKNYLGL